MAEPKERTLPSLVADDLVDLSRRAITYGRVRLSHEYVPDEGDSIELPLVAGDGRPPAIDYAVLELLVEIRDALVAADPLARLAHVHVDLPAEKPKADEKPSIRLPLRDDGQIDVDLETVFGEVLAGAYLDPGRIAKILPALDRETRVALARKAVR